MPSEKYSANKIDYVVTKKKVFDASNTEFQEYYDKNWENCGCRTRGIAICI